MSLSLTQTNRSHYNFIRFVGVQCKLFYVVSIFIKLFSIVDNDVLYRLCMYAFQ